MYSFNKKVGIVCGASRGIGLSMVELLLAEHNIEKIYATTRDINNESLCKLKSSYPNKLIISELTANNELDYVNLSNDVKNSGGIDFIINCIGVLHFSSNTPERRVDDLNSEDLIKSFQTNTFPTLFLAKHFKSLIRKSDKPLLCALSAKVGSIDDNSSGGWYGYRMSKAALNMAIKNLSIEFNRLNKNSIVVAVHPGTTETDLSKPFLAMAKKKYIVHKPRQTAENILATLACAKNGQFLSWDGAGIKW